MSILITIFIKRGIEIIKVLLFVIISVIFQGRYKIAKQGTVIN